MRSYKKIIPFFLTFALLLTAMYSFKNKRERQTMYETALNEARDMRDKGAIKDSLAKYNNALDIYFSFPVSLEAGEIYLEEESYQGAEKWYTEVLLAKYPKEPGTYLYGMRLYAAKNSYSSLFSTYDKYLGRELQSAEIDEFIKQYLYIYSLVGEYSSTGLFSPATNCAAVQHGNRWGYISGRGSLILPYNYAEAGAPETAFLPVVTQDGKALFVDSQGNERINENFILEKDPEFGTVKRFQSIESGLIPAFNGKIWNYYDAETYEKRFGGFADALPMMNGTSAVSNGSKWAVIDSTGTLLTDYLYDEVLADGRSICCRYGVLLVRIGREYQLIDKTGNPVTAEYYSKAKSFNDADTMWAAVQKNGRWIFLDREGGEHDLGDFEDAESFSNGLAAVKQNGLWGYIDTEGNTVIENKFYGAGPYFSKGVAFVETVPGVWQLLILFRYNH